MNYQQAIDYLHAVMRFGSKPGLTRIQQLLDAMGNPQHGLRCIHVAGTNGKGSTSAMLDSILRKQGYTVGLCTSPYMLDFRERIRINGAMIGRDELAERVTEVDALIQAMLARGQMQPTEFEIIVAITLQTFAAHKVDYCVIEVGLGGRWDATNAIDAPLVAAITSISYDHTEYLGDTLPQIAREKCGIFKPGSRAVAMGGQPAEVAAVIREEAEHNGLPLIFTAPEALQIRHSNRDGSQFAYRGNDYTLRLAGHHQIQNAMVAIECVEALRQCGVAISAQALRDGLYEAQWSGRLQCVQQEPLVVLDVAHNPDGMRALCEALDTLYPTLSIHAVMSMCSDKQAHSCVPMLAQRAAAFYAAAADTPRALPAQSLLALAQPHCARAQAYGSVKQAVQAALATAKIQDMVLICGSHYMMEEARDALGVAGTEDRVNA